MLAPLLPSRGDNGLAVETLQRYLNDHGAALTVDGDFGGKTAAALDRVGPPPEVECPDVGLWIDRSWALDTAKYAKTLAKVGAKRVGLMLNSLDDGPRFDPFAKPDALRRAVDTFEAEGLHVDCTPWLYPSVEYVDSLAAYLRPLFADNGNVRLDNDCESAFGRSGKHAAAADQLFQHFPVRKLRLSIPLCCGRRTQW